jgi:hypothetical protein
MSNGLNEATFSPTKGRGLSHQGLENQRIVNSAPIVQFQAIFAQPVPKLVSDTRHSPVSGRTPSSGNRNGRTEGDS